MLRPVVGEEGRRPGGSVVKNPTADEEMQVRSLRREDALEEAWQPPPVFLPVESHGQRNLIGYSPRACKKLDMAEHRHKSRRV